MVRTTTMEALLGLLSMEPMSGYDLKQRIDFSIGNFWRESYGQIYPALRTLEEEGLVSSQEKGKAGRKVYRLTEGGQERLQQWLTITPRPWVPRHETLLKLFFGDNVPTAISLAHIADLRRRFTADLERYEVTGAHLLRSHPKHPALPYWLMTLNYGRDEARMIVNWCDESSKLLLQMQAR
jgi:PadR family transcriptional regulator AphA